MFRRLLLVFVDKELRNKFFTVIGLLIIARLLAHVPIPFLKASDLTTLLDSDAVLNLLNTIAGGSFGSLSFVMLGVGPLVTASIVMQLLGVIVPKINEFQKEQGEQGKNIINRWTRFITVPLAALNAFGILQFLNNSGAQSGVNFSLPPELTNPNILESFPYWFVVITSMVAGSIIMMWIGEIITELKLGNGVSLLILSGIVVRLPRQVSTYLNDSFDNFKLLFEKFFLQNGWQKVFNWDVWKAFLWENPTWGISRTVIYIVLIFLFTLTFVVFINDAVRKVLVIYSKRGHNEGKSRTLDAVKADLPIKVNIAGVLPIIFAISFILFPSIISRFFLSSNTTALKTFATNVESYLSVQTKESQVVVNKDIFPKYQFLGIYLTSNKTEVDEVLKYDYTEGQELLGFTLTTQKDVKNSFFENTPLNDVNIANTYLFRFDGTNFGFLPEFTIRWNGVLAYTLFYFLLIVFFTYFYTSQVAFKTDEVAENLQKGGAFIPGHRPGVETQNYLSYVSNRLNVVGSLFLALIAVLPFVFGQFLQGDAGNSLSSSIVGGTTLLILVSVTIETLKQMEAQATIVDYDRFMK
jgi:preprotein translocase SecY subunit